MTVRPLSSSRRAGRRPIRRLGWAGLQRSVRGLLLSLLLLLLRLHEVLVMLRGGCGVLLLKLMELLLLLVCGNKIRNCIFLSNKEQSWYRLNFIFKIIPIFEKNHNEKYVCSHCWRVIVGYPLYMEEVLEWAWLMERYMGDWRLNWFCCWSCCWCWCCSAVNMCPWLNLVAASCVSLASENSGGGAKIGVWLRRPNSGGGGTTLGKSCCWRKETALIRLIN